MIVGLKIGGRKTRKKKRIQVLSECNEGEEKTSRGVKED